jgi:hypothetical protein
MQRKPIPEKITAGKNDRAHCVWPEKPILAAENLRELSLFGENHQLPSLCQETTL